MKKLSLLRAADAGEAETADSSNQLVRFMLLNGTVHEYTGLKYVIIDFIYFFNIKCFC